MYAQFDINPAHWVENWISSNNPITSFAGQISDAYTWMIGLYENLLIQAPGVQQQSWIINLLNSALGDAQFVSIVSSLFLSGLVVFKHGKFHNAAWSWLMVIFLGGGGGELWYRVCFGMMAASRQMSKSAEIYHTTHSHHSFLLYFDAIGSVLGSIFGYGVLLVYGFGLFCLLLSYSVVNVLIMAFGIVAFGLRFLGKISEKISDMFISIGLVTMLLGPPAAILSINVGRYLGDALANSPLGQTSGAAPLMGWVGMQSGFFWAFAWQIILLVGMSIAVSKVTGHVNALSQVFGRVETKPERHQVDVNTQRQEHALGQRPMAVSESGPGSVGKMVRYVKQEGKQQLIAAGATAVAAAATGGSSVAFQAVGTAAARVAQRNTPSQPKKKEA